MVNKFLYPNRESKTFIFKIGEWMEKNGYEVQHFGTSFLKCIIREFISSSYFVFENYSDKIKSYFGKINRLYSI